MPSIGDTVREGIQGMAAGREADQTVAGIGDTVLKKESSSSPVSFFLLEGIFLFFFVFFDDD